MTFWQYLPGILSDRQLATAWQSDVWLDFLFSLCYSIIRIVFRKNHSDFFFSFFVPTFTHKKATFPTKQNTLYIETFKHLMYFLYLMRLIFLIISNCDQAEFYKSFYWELILLFFALQRLATTNQQSRKWNPTNLIG